MIRRVDSFACGLAFAVLACAPIAACQPPPVDAAVPPINAAKAEKATARTLTVLVTGDDKPIRNAAVKIVAPPGADSEPRTGNDGQVTFKLNTSGPVKVRVIAEGWESALQEIVLADEAHKLRFQLKQLAPPKPPGPPN